MTTWQDPGNRRNKMVRLTPRAQGLGETMDGLRRWWESAMLRDFSEEEAAQLRNMLIRVYQNIKTAESR